MVPKRQICSLTHFLLYAASLVLICGGTYLISLQKEQKYKVIISCVVVFGLLAVLFFTLFWTSYRMKRQLYKTVRQQHIQVYTIARPDSFPPSYEQSQRDRQPAAPELVTAVGVDVAVGPAPPLYSQDSSEALGCTWSWEQPPPYRETGCIQQQHAL
ncbi:transmembrane protein 252-like [Takifugu flavidus]|nr:transmembrane protein 252-like [Takifugu flavidus]